MLVSPRRRALLALALSSVAHAGLHLRQGPGGPDEFTPPLHFPAPPPGAFAGRPPFADAPPPRFPASGPQFPDAFPGPQPPFSPPKGFPGSGKFPIFAAKGDDGEDKSSSDSKSKESDDKDGESKKDSSSDDSDSKSSSSSGKDDGDDESSGDDSKSSSSSSSSSSKSSSSKSKTSGGDDSSSSKKGSSSSSGKSGSSKDDNSGSDDSSSDGDKGSSSSSDDGGPVSSTRPADGSKDEGGSKTTSRTTSETTATSTRPTSTRSSSGKTRSSTSSDARSTPISSSEFALSSPTSLSNGIAPRRSFPLAAAGVIGAISSFLVVSAIIWGLWLGLRRRSKRVRQRQHLTMEHGPRDSLGWDFSVAKPPSDVESASARILTLPSFPSMTVTDSTRQSEGVPFWLRAAELNVPYQMPLGREQYPFAHAHEASQSDSVSSLTVRPGANRV